MNHENVQHNLFVISFRSTVPVEEITILGQYIFAYILLLPIGKSTKIGLKSHSWAKISTVLPYVTSIPKPTPGNSPGEMHLSNPESQVLCSRDGEFLFWNSSVSNSSCTERLVKVTKPASSARPGNHSQGCHGTQGKAPAHQILYWSECTSTGRAAVTHHCAGHQLLLAPLTSNERECEEKNFKIKPVKTREI